MDTGEIRDPWWLAREMQVCALCLMTGLFGVLVFQAFRMAYLVEGNDFTSYLLAAKALWDGNNPYQVEMPFPYLYPLFLAFVLIPLTFVPYWLANVVWITLCVAGLVASCAALQQVASRECGTTMGRRLAFPGLVVLLAFYLPVQSTMLQGQVNPILLFCCAMFFYTYTRNCPVWAGVWLAAAIAIKVLPAVLLVFLVVRGRYRILLWTFLFTALFCALPVVVAGKSLVTYYQTYLDAFVLPSMAGARVNTPTHFSLQGSIGWFFPTAPGVWLKIACGLTVTAGLFAVEMAARSRLVGDWSIFRREIMYCEKTAAENMDLSPLAAQVEMAARSRDSRRDIWPFCAYLVGCLLLSPVVEIHHFVLAIPAVFLLGIKAFFDRSWTTRTVILCIVAFVACFNVATKVDPTMLSYFASLAILLLLLFFAAAPVPPCAGHGREPLAASQ